MESIHGQRIVVTAGAGGAGLVIADVLARQGANVAVCDIDEGAVARLEKQASLALARVVDVSSAEAVQSFCKEAVGRLSGIDVLVNNAGISGPTARAEDISTADWDHTIAVNLTSQFFFARAAIPHMKKERRGLIVNISSSSVKTGLPLRLPYVVSKAGVLSLTTNLARELGPDGIRVNAILPGAIRGERLQRVINAKAEALGIRPEDYSRSLFRYISLRTPVEPEDIAAMIEFLASPNGERITGQLIGIDGNVEWEE